MLSSAVKCALAILALNGQSDLTSFDRNAWGRIEPSVAYLLDGGNRVGVAALIDDSGLFLVASATVGKGPIRAQLGKAEILFDLVGRDEITQLSLLQAKDWSPAGAKPLKPVEKVSVNESLLVALPFGTIRGEYVGGNRLGVMNPSRRLVTLNELRFEGRTSSIAGGLVFTAKGELVGALNATLQSQDQIQARGAAAKVAAQSEPGSVGGFGGGGGGRALPSPTPQNNYRQFGPGELTTAYTISPKVLARVVAGFRSPDHHVAHPAIGVLCRDSMLGGAEIQQVLKGSPAEAAGLMAGDVIQVMGSQRIKNQFEFAEALMDLEPGQSLKVMVIRRSMQVFVDVVVGKS